MPLLTRRNLLKASAVAGAYGVGHRHRGKIRAGGSSARAAGAESGEDAGRA